MNWKSLLILLLVTTLAATSKRLVSHDDFRRILSDATREVESLQRELDVPTFMPGHGKRGVNAFSLQMERVNDIAKRVTKSIAEIERISLKEASERRKQLMRATGNTDLCLDPIQPCSTDESTSMFRTISGRCNNVANPTWGSAGIPLRRILKACRREFFTTFSSRKSEGMLTNTMVLDEREDCPSPAVTALDNGACVTTSLLPNAQLVSATFHYNITPEAAPSSPTSPPPPSPPPPPMVTQLFTTFGQFLDHDITLTSTYNPPDCCVDSSDTEQCAPIKVAKEDSVFKKDKCLNFVRSLSFCDDGGCASDPMNAITSFIDASQVYGSDVNTSNSLRTFTDGLLQTSTPSLMPQINGVFTAGDIRALENPGLASYQTVFLREHNRIAKWLKKDNPTWSDETIFQNARRILIAEYQNIVLDEFLPLIVGKSGMKLFFLGDVFSVKYDNTQDPTIFNEFATAAYRFGHSMVNGRQQRKNQNTNPPSLLDAYLLRYNFNNDSLYKENTDISMKNIIAGMSDQAAQSFDPILSYELTRFLNAKQSDNFAFGEDLATRNIQRGRDHGLQSWLYYNRFCNSIFPGPPTASDDWSSLNDERLMSNENKNKLMSLYKNVSDIDLFTGGLAEKPVPDGIVGPTFACIIGLQFRRLVAGDRYFFNNTASNGPKFTQQQVKMIRGIKMSDILCANYNSSQATVPQNAFEMVPRPPPRNAPLPPPPNGPPPPPSTTTPPPSTTPPPPPPPPPNQFISCANAKPLDVTAFFR